VTDLSDVTVVALTGSLDRTGGAERAFRTIVAGFESRLGMRVELAAHLPPDDPEVRDRATVLRPAGAGVGPGMLGRMRGLIERAPRPAILFGFQINSNVVASVANRLLAADRRLPVVLNDRAAITEMTVARPGGGPADRMRAAVFRTAARAAYRQADCVVCNARANAELVRTFVGGASPPVETIYNPLDAEGLQSRFAERDRTRWQSDLGPLVVAHGRLDPQKGFDVLLQAFARVRDEWPQARLRIVGAGAPRGAREALVGALGLTDAVELPGFSADPLAAIEDGDVYVLPSRFEGLPNALLEAIAVGLPAIAADCPTGPAEILSAEAGAGLLFPVDDLEALVSHLRGLLGDGGRRAALAAGARRRALDFAPAVATDAYAAIFRRILGRSGD